MAGSVMSAMIRIVSQHAHGGGQTRHAWKGSADVINARGYNTCAIDLRGHGDSDWAEDGNYSMEAFADDLVTVSKFIGRPPILVGASLGGIAAMIAAGEVDTKCFKALVLVDITPSMNREGVEKIVGFMSDNLSDGFSSPEHAAESISAYLPNRTKPKNLDGLMKNLRIDAAGRYRWHWDPRFIEGARSQSASRDPERIEKVVTKISIPIALIRGRNSELVTDEEVARFQQLVPEALYYNVENAGHMVAGDSNSIFNRALIEHLEYLENRSV